jgi:hypothetical protein
MTTMEFSKREEKILKIMSEIDKDEFTLDDIFYRYYALEPQSRVKNARSSVRQCVNLIVLKQAFNGEKMWNIQATKGRGNKMRIFRAKQPELEMA